MTEKEFIQFLINNSIIYDGDVLQKLRDYCELLKEYSVKFNLTAITKDDEIYLKHFCDSILLQQFIKIEDFPELIDVGTGAGFPGIVLKIFNEDLKLYLVESNTKKCQFLKLLCEKLNLSKVEIINERAETFALMNLDRFSLVVSRAVSNLKVLTELCLPLVKKDGLFIAMKGKEEDEIKASQKTVSILKGEIIQIEKYKLPVLNHDRSLIIIKKTGKTPKGYPRSYDKIIKNN